MSSEHLSETASTDTGTSIDHTTRVRTVTSGTIHGDRVEAPRIISASSFPVDDDAFVRLSPASEDDATDFNIGINSDSISVRPAEGPDVCITGTFDEMSNFFDNPVTRISFQVPYEARHTFSDIRDTNQGHAEYTNGNVPRWNVTDEWLGVVVKDVLDRGFNIVARLSQIRELFTPHDEHTVGGSGEFIITDKALVEPDHYETDDPRPGTGHGKGGNPHAIEYFLQNGECPVPDCDGEFDRFRGLKTHVAGKCAHKPCDGPHHDLNLRRHEVTVADEHPVEATAD